MTSPRVVLDTNIVLSALLFNQGQLAWPRRAWQRGVLTPLVCRETTAELLRVLAYPKFHLSPEEREALLADFLPHTEVAALPSPWPVLASCRDAKDQVFLVLTHVTAADALITGDADLLALRDTFPHSIRTAQEWAARHPQVACR